MRIGIDKTGRVVLPKAVREQYGLDPGTILEVESSDEVIVLRPIHEEPLVREKDGFLVVSATVDEDLSDAVSRMREERIGGITSVKSKESRQ
ncbi:MAG: AbrB/MazE/SpoVT family DNA-binding domain-containing protein [Pirellulales bacterium]|nr:AbrB/MazE/SpoVT family DNA-binding domain-containing protein [Pirellulales bacterium]